MAVHVIVWKRDPKKPINFEDWFLGGAITLFTGEPYTHAAIFVKGNTYQNTIEKVKGKMHSGAIKSDGLPVTKEELVFLKLNQEVDEDKLVAFLDGTVSNSRNYSIIKLLLFIVIYPIRKLLNLNHINPYFRGEVCSGYIDNSLEYVGVGKLTDTELEDWEAPRDFIDSKLFTTVDRSTVL